MGVPLIDASFYQATGEARERGLQEMIRGFQDYGFVRLKNHGIPQEQMEKTLAWVSLCLTSLHYLQCGNPCPVCVSQT
jgi:isopenicillin N synthase-like dioxygenase